MVRIENDMYLYEVEPGSYSYCEDKETGDCAFLDHRGVVDSVPLLKELIQTKIGIVDAVLRNLTMSVYWSIKNEQRSAAGEAEIIPWRSHAVNS